MLKHILSFFKKTVPSVLGMAIIALVTTFFVNAIVVLAFSAPGGAPSTGTNVAAPVNVGSASQIKSGALWVGSLGTDGGASFAGAKVTVTTGGQVKITGGAPGLNKVLTSDATGLATWTTPASFSETDPQVSTLTASKWCVANAGGTAIDCTTATPSFSEVDPKVGALTTSYVPRWSGTALANGKIFDNGTNVGIGTASPGYTLDVNGSFRSGSINTGPISTGNMSVSGSGWYAVYVTGASNFFGSALYVNGYYGGIFGYAGTYPWTSGVIGSSPNGYGVYGNGMYGVLGSGTSYGVYGQASSGNGVYGYGATGVYGYGTTAWGVWCYGVGSAKCGGNKAWTNTSDARLKKNITTITGALEKVLKLRGVNYIWKDDATSEKHIGLIAQEVLPVIPEIIGQDEKGYYNITLGEMTPVLVEAIKELKAENDALKSENAGLRVRLDNLEAKVNMLLAK